MRADELGFGLRILVLKDECGDLHEVVVEFVQGFSLGAGSGQGWDVPDKVPGEGQRSMMAVKVRMRRGPFGAGRV